MSPDPVAARWRELMLEACDQIPEDAALMLSGGMDSGTILAALRELGRRPWLASFSFEGRPNADLTAAYGMRDWREPFTEVILPDKPAQLAAEIKAVIAAIRSARKTHVQCAHPVFRVAEVLAHAHGLGNLILGTGGIIEDNTTHAKLLFYEGEGASRAYRRSQLFEIAGSATEKMQEAALFHGVEPWEPYSNPALAEYALSLDVAEINKPGQKGIAVRAFPEFWSRFKPRRNRPLQIGSGLREVHDRLLDSRFNRRGSKSVVAIYNDFLEDVEEETMELPL